MTWYNFACLSEQNTQGALFSKAAPLSQSGIVSKVPPINGYRSVLAVRLDTGSAICGGHFAMGKFIDLTAKRFGRLTVHGLANDGIVDGSHNARWRCLCDCGNETTVISPSLRRGRTKSCGCLASDLNRQRNFIDMIGRKCGRLTIIRFHHYSPRPDNRQESMWLCVCDCGNELIVSGSSLRSGNTQSCGCFRLERLRETITLPKGLPAKHEAVKNYKFNAAKGGRVWELSDDLTLELMQMDCFYCGSEPHGSIRGLFRYNGLDRVDNSKGYTRDNVVPCCADCNRAKRTHSVDEFLGWVKQVYEHSILEKGKVKNGINH